MSVRDDSRPTAGPATASAATPPTATSAGAPTASRPRFAPGYGVDPAATEGMLPWSAVVGQLTAARNYWVSTTRPDGRPHAAPVWGLWFEDAFAFGTDPASQKGRNLAANPEVVVHLESGDDVVILEGTIETVTERAWLERFCQAYLAKYGMNPGGDEVPAGMYRLRPRVALAWREQAFPASVTRFTFPA